MDRMGRMETGKRMPSCLSLSKDAGEGGEALSTLRNPCAWWSDGRVVTAALALVAAFAATAPASELPPVAGVGYPNVPIDRGKKVSVFFGYTYGFDSNIEYAASGSEAPDFFQEGLVGLIYVTGVPSRSFDLRYEGKLDFFQTRADLNYMDHVVKGSIVRQTEVTSFILRGSYELLARSTEIETVGLMGRQRISVAPDLGFRRGQLELVALGSFGVNSYEVSAFDYANYGAGGELRLWRGETRQWFTHFDMGAVNYGPAASKDYNYRRLYLGLRAERTARSGYEVALGVQGNATKFSLFSPAQEELFASVRFTRLLLNGRGALVAGYTQGAEASLISDFKSVQRITGRFSYAANTRLSLTAGATLESADFGNYDEVTDPAPGDMSRLAWDAGVMYEIGSPERLHGRLFVSYGTANRSGNGVVGDYARTRWFGGVALVY